MKTTTTLMVGLLLSLSLIAMTPTSSAHSCSSSDDNCNQPCDGSEPHSHSWRDSSGRWQNCNSDPSPGDPDELTVCDVYRLVYEIFDGKIAITNSANLESSGKFKAFEFSETRCNTAAVALA